MQQPTMGNETGMLPQAVVDALAARLAALPDLRLPAQLRQGDAGEGRKRDYLARLLQHDPGGRCRGAKGAGRAAAAAAGRILP